MKENAYRAKSWMLPGMKAVEVQVSRWENAPFFSAPSLWHRKKGTDDHHGVEISVTFWWHEFRIDFYDRRHKEDFHGNQ